MNTKEFETLTQPYPLNSPTLYQLQKEVGAWSEKNFPHNQPHHPLLGLAYYVGELSDAHLKSEQGIRGDSLQHHADKIDAVGDIVIYLADYCHRNNINLSQAVHDTWAKVKQRNWSKNPETGS